LAASRFALLSSCALHFYFINSAAMLGVGRSLGPFGGLCFSIGACFRSSFLKASNKSASHPRWFKIHVPEREFE
jgi:hypothetical protein